MYHSDPIKYIFLEIFWSGRVKYCIFDDDDHGDYDYGDDVCTKFRGLGSGQAA